MDFCLSGSRILWFWQVLKSVYKLIIELYVLQGLFVRESNNDQRRGNIISNFTNYFKYYFKLLHLLRQPSPLEDNFTMCLSFSDPPGKTFSPLQFFSLDKKRIDLDTQLKGELADCFRKLSGCFLIPQVEQE